MKLVIIYGPPAVGKLSVATELIKLTKFKLLHNHLVRDLLTSMIGEDDKLYRVDIPLRKNLIRYAIKMEVPSLIFTTCYVANTEGKRYFKDIIKIVEKSGGKIYFVKLITSEKVLCKRVVREDRKVFGKFRNPVEMKKFLHKHRCYDSIQYKNSLEIDNTKLSAKKVAKMINNRFKF